MPYKQNTVCRAGNSEQAKDLITAQVTYQSCGGGVRD